MLDALTPYWISFHCKHCNVSWLYILYHTSICDIVPYWIHWTFINFHLRLWFMIWYFIILFFHLILCCMSWQYTVCFIRHSLFHVVTVSCMFLYVILCSMSVQYPVCSYTSFFVPCRCSILYVLRRHSLFHVDAVSCMFYTSFFVPCRCLILYVLIRHSLFHVRKVSCMFLDVILCSMSMQYPVCS